MQNFHIHLLILLSARHDLPLPVCCAWCFQSRTSTLVNLENKHPVSCWSGVKEALRQCRIEVTRNVPFSEPTSNLSGCLRSIQNICLLLVVTLQMCVHTHPLSLRHGLPPTCYIIHDDSIFFCIHVLLELSISCLIGNEIRVSIFLFLVPVIIWG